MYIHTYIHIYIYYGLNQNKVATQSRPFLIPVGTLRTSIGHLLAPVEFMNDGSAAPEVPQDSHSEAPVVPKDHLGTRLRLVEALV